MRIIEVRECLRCPNCKINSFKGYYVCRLTDRVIAFSKSKLDGKIHPTCPLPKKEIE